jgi:hypothetical protein
MQRQSRVGSSQKGVATPRINLPPRRLQVHGECFTRRIALLVVYQRFEKLLRCAHQFVRSIVFVLGNRSKKFVPSRSSPVLRWATPDSTQA